MSQPNEDDCKLNTRLRRPHPSFSTRARKAFQLANQEAQRLNHAQIGIEHLLLGLVKETVSPASRALTQSGFDLQSLRRRIEVRNPKASSSDAILGSLPYTDELAKFIDAAVSASDTSGVAPITPEMLLLGLLDWPTEWVSALLKQSRFRFWRLRRKLRS